MVVKLKLHQKNIDAVINKGASVIQDHNDDRSKDWTLISVRLPKCLLKSLDEMRATSIGMTRNAWILQQFQKLLEDERHSQS
jgi:hypothetical protein